MIQAAARIVDLTYELGLNIDRKLLVVNQAREGQEKGINEMVKQYELVLVGIVPEDADLQEFDLTGRPTVELEKDNRAVAASYGIFDKMFNE
jgi:CO dehydrogenase nickel-insertion accessory protein CooC1